MFHRKFFFIIPFILALIGGIVLSIITKPVYQSSTVVRVSQSQLLSRAMQRLVPGISAQERLTNLRRLITSHTYLKRLVETLNLINEPEILLADEPTGNLDQKNGKIVLDLIKDLHKEGHTIVMITHNPDIAKLGNKRIDLIDGKINFDKTS